MKPRARRFTLTAGAIGLAVAAVVIAFNWGVVRDQEQSTFTVILKDGGATKIQVIKEIRSITNLGLKDAKDLFERAPTPVKEGISKEEAVKFKKQLEDVGATVEIK